MGRGRGMRWIQTERTRERAGHMRAMDVRTEDCNALGMMKGSPVA